MEVSMGASMEIINFIKDLALLRIMDHVRARITVRIIDLIMCISCSVFRLVWVYTLV